MKELERLIDELSRRADSLDIDHAKDTNDRWWYFVGKADGIRDVIRILRYVVKEVQNADRSQ